MRSRRDARSGSGQRVSKLAKSVTQLGAAGFVELPRSLNLVDDRCHRPIEPCWKFRPQLTYSLKRYAIEHAGL